jgi:hypothetical protein
VVVVLRTRRCCVFAQQNFEVFGFLLLIDFFFVFLDARFLGYGFDLRDEILSAL